MGPDRTWQLVAGATVAIVLGLASLSEATPQGAAPVRVVFPTGAWPADVDNVQAALNQGGTVLLMATDAAGMSAAFNFGSSDSGGGFVSVTVDVAVLGETVGGRMTTIRGGFLPFRSLAPVQTAIKGIRFHESGLVAINVGLTSGLEIVGNVVTDMVGDADFGEAIAVFLSNLANPNRISGTVTIADNSLAVDPAGRATFPAGIVILGAAADVIIRGNRITDARNGGISLLRTRRVSIVNNLVAPGRGDPAMVFGNGISLTSPLDGGEDVVIQSNTVVCDNPNADGILIGGFPAPVSGAMIEKNDVTMHGSDFGAISLYGAVSRTHVRNNKISGDGSFALQIAQGFDPADAAIFNRFHGNNLSHFVWSVADVFFDVNAKDNVLAGHCASVVDFGTNNQYTCVGGGSGH